MKKLVFSLLTAAVLMALLTVSAFAAGITPTDQSQNGTTSVYYTVNPSFVVTIPDSVRLGESATVSASDVLIDEDKQVVVKLTGTSGLNNAFTLTNGKTGLVSYEIRMGSTALKIGSTVLTVNPKESASGSQSLNFVSTTEKPKYSGQYTGTVTFTVSVESVH